jgi:predicted DNA-binding protein
MVERSDVMVLRSINLPTDMDEQLRSLAFQLRRPKADLVRYFIDVGLTQLSRSMRQNPSAEALERLGQQIAEGGSSAVEHDGIEADLSHAERMLAATRR